MKYIITIALIISCTAMGMDTDSQKEQLAQKLRNIVRDGNVQLFEDNQTAFAKGLEYHDLHCAHWQCEHRLTAIEKLNIICTDIRVDILVALMQKEIKKNHLGLYAVKDHMQEKYKLDNPAEQEALNTAAKIAETLVWHEIHLIGPHMMHLKKKIAREKRPAQFLAKEKQNTTQLRDDVQQILDDEFEPPKGLEYDKERDLYFWCHPKRKGK